MIEELLENALKDRLVKRTLEKGGWWPGYRVDAQELLAGLWDEGYSRLPIAVEILTLLGGIRASSRGVLRRRFSPSEFEFNPWDSAVGEAPRIHDLEAKLGVRVCPIGEWGGEFILLVDENGRILSEAPYMLSVFGDDIASALKLMVRGAPEPKRLPCWP